MHLLFTDVTAATLLRYNELENPWTLKKIIKFAAFLLGDVDIKIKEEDLKTSTRLVSNKGIKQAIMKGDKIVVVTITARDNEQHGIMRFFILKLLAKYVKEYQRLLKFYNDFFGTEREEIEPRSELGTLAGEENDLPNIKLLRHADPNVWWNAAMLVPLHPIRTFKSSPFVKTKLRNTELWVATSFDGQFESSTWKRICKQLLPSIRIREENSLSTTRPRQMPNLTSLWFKPWTKQRNSSAATEVPTEYIRFVGQQDNVGNHSVQAGQYQSNQRSTQDAQNLEPGRFGPVFGSIIKYLQATRMTRMGVRRSQSSFLHCVLYALEWPKFRNIYTKPEADQVVEELRSYLPEYAVACMQENPDRTVEEIATELGDPSVFLDPSRHYRAWKSSSKSVSSRL